MQAILISIQPKWVQLIIGWKKTVEIRKTQPKISAPFKCYIYMTASKKRGQLWEYDTAYETPSGEIRDGAQTVIGEFICDYIEPVTQSNRHAISRVSCVPLPDMYNYAGPKGLGGLKAWHISSIVIYDKPKKLSEFYRLDDSGKKEPITRAPQNWCYVEERVA